MGVQKDVQSSVAFPKPEVVLPHRFEKVVGDRDFPFQRADQLPLLRDGHEANHRLRPFGDHHFFAAQGGIDQFRKLSLGRVDGKLQGPNGM